MTDHVFVSAVFVARQEKLEALGEAIAAVVDATRSEQGCLRYDPHCCQMMPVVISSMKSGNRKSIWMTI